MGSYCNAIWRCRYFWLSLVRMDLHYRYRGSLLGVGWSLIQPLALTFVLAMLFSRIFHQNVLDHALFILVGLSFWTYFHTAMVQGCRSFLQGELYIRQCAAPLAIYPLRTVLSGGFHFIVAVLAALAFSAIIQMQGTDSRGFDPTALLSLVPTLCLLLIFGWAIAVLAGLAHVHFRDTGHLCEVGIQILFYLTPIMYPRQLLEQKHLLLLLEWHPLVPFLDLLRAPLVDGMLPTVATSMKAMIITLSLAIGAVTALARLERRLIFRL